MAAPVPIIVPVTVVVVVLIFILLIYLIWHFKRKKKSDSNPAATTAHSAAAVSVSVGMDVVPVLKKTNSKGQVVFSPEVARAQKYRERAKSVSIGKPNFKLLQKKEADKSNLYRTLKQHPNFQEYDFLEEKNNNELSKSTTGGTGPSDAAIGNYIERLAPNYSAPGTPVLMQSRKSSFMRNEDASNSAINNGSSNNNNNRLSLVNDQDLEAANITGNNTTTSSPYLNKSPKRRVSEDMKYQAALFEKQNSTSDKMVLAPLSRSSTSKQFFAPEFNDNLATVIMNDTEV